MFRTLPAALIVLCCVYATSHAQKAETKPAPQLTEGEVHILRADYQRELWVGLPWPGMPADELLKTLRAVCDDTTTVAVIDVRIVPGLAVGHRDSEARALRLARANALAQLHKDVDFSSRRTRMVSFGGFDSARAALELADRDGAETAEVMLIDPPVHELEGALSPVYRTTINVLLHSRSADEFERERRQVADALGTDRRTPRVFNSDRRFDSFKDRLANLYGHTRGYRLADGKSAADVVNSMKGMQVIAVGELHGNAGAHRLQLEALRAMHAQGGKLALSTEQFERDVQPVLNRYLRGEIEEAEFLREARPWPNYADYRPLMEFCKQHGIPVLAGNIPRYLAARIHKEGPDSFDNFNEDERGWSARELKALPGAYRDKFMGLMGGHSERLDNMFAAQCIKDDTMAESIADWLAANPKGRVLHINGAFHSAGGLGVPEKLDELVPDIKIGLITCIQPGEQAEPADNEWLATVPAMR